MPAPVARFWPKSVGPRVYLRKHLGVLGFGMAAVHAIMSILLFSPAYYERLFNADNGRLTMIAESSMLFAILGFLIFASVTVTSLPPMQKYMHPQQWLFVQRLGYLAYLLVLLHVGLLGWGGWFRASSYTYGLASISLISALIIILVVLLRILVALFPRRR